MTFTWRFEAADSSERTPETVGTGGDFPTQADAETWVGEVWPDLLADGIDAVTLLEGGRVVYGPMSLQAPE